MQLILRVGNVRSMKLLTYNYCLSLEGEDKGEGVSLSFCPWTGRHPIEAVQKLCSEVVG